MLLCVKEDGRTGEVDDIFPMDFLKLFRFGDSLSNFCADVRCCCNIDCLCPLREAAAGSFGQEILCRRLQECLQQSTAAGEPVGDAGDRSDLKTQPAGTEGQSFRRQGETNNDSRVDAKGVAVRVFYPSLHQ